MALGPASIVRDVPGEAFASSTLRRGPAAPWPIYAVPPLRFRLIRIEIELEIDKFLEVNVRIGLAEFAKIGKFGAYFLQVWRVVFRVAGEGW